MQPTAPDVEKVREAARFLMEAIAEGYGPETAKALDADLRAGSEQAFRFLYGAAKALLARIPEKLPEGFAELPGIYWEQAERIKVAARH